MENFLAIFDFQTNPDIISRLMSSLFSVGGETPAEVLGGLVGGVGLLVGVALLIKQAITGDEGFKTIKQIALFSLLPLASVAVAQVINGLDLEGRLLDFFVIIRHLLLQWNFFLDIPTLFTILTLSLSMLGAYWGYKMVIFFQDFFNTK